MKKKTFFFSLNRIKSRALDDERVRPRNSMTIPRFSTGKTRAEACSQNKGEKERERERESVTENRRQSSIRL